jgi:hypothetical protein
MTNRKEYQKNYRLTHKNEIKKQRAEHYINNKEAINSKNNDYYENNKSLIKQAQHQYYEDNKKIFKDKNYKYYEANKERILSHNKEYSAKHLPELKIKVLTHYGNGKCACIKCGFDDIRALTIDHVNGGGSKHRRDNNITHFYTWLIKNNYPSGYVTLCINCNFIKRTTNREQYKKKEGRF